MQPKRDTNPKTTLALLRAQMQPLPHPRNTCDFPAGLISEYIKIVDKLRNDKK